MLAREMTSVKQQLRTFGETTTVRGIPRALKNKDKNKFIFAMWTLAVIVCTAMLVYNLTMVIIKYFKYDYSTVYTEDDSRQVFPDVTICFTLPPLKSVANKLTWVEYNEEMTMKRERWSQSEVETKLGSSFTGSEYEDLWSFLQSKRGYFTSLPLALDDVLVSSTAAADDSPNFVVDCDLYDWDWSPYENLTCSQLMQLHWDPKYFQCLTFAIPPAHNQSVRSLSMILYMDEFDNAPANILPSGPSLATAAGLRVALHESGTTADMQLAVSVGPGTETTIDVMGTIRRRLPYPYSSCTDQRTMEDDANESYDYQKCIESCLQSQVIDTCQCVVASFKFTDAQLRYVNYTVCGNQTSSINGTFENSPDNDLNGFHQLYCADGMVFDWNSCLDACDPRCKEYLYGWTVTSSNSWPHPSYQLAFYRQYIKEAKYKDHFKEYDKIDSDYTNKTITAEEAIQQIGKLDLINRNFLQLNIVLGHYTPYMMKDVPSMSPEQLWSSIGGVLSLWLGVTIMTTVEFIELLYAIVSNWYASRVAKVYNEGVSGPQP